MVFGMRKEIDCETEPSAAKQEEWTWEGMGIVPLDTRLGSWVWPLLNTFQVFNLEQAICSLDQSHFLKIQ